MRKLIEGLLAQHEETQTISEIHQNGYWNLDKISFDLPRVVVDSIQAIPIQSFGEREDTLMWKFFVDGEFNVASIYLLAITDQPKPPSFSGCWVWGVDTLPKIRHFLWLCNHASIPTKQVIKKGELIALCFALYAVRRRSLSYILSEIAHLGGNFG